MAHYHSPRFLLAVEDGGSGSDIAAEGDEENKFWFPPLDYEVYYPIIWTLFATVVILLIVLFCSCVGWIVFCTLYCSKSRERGSKQLEESGARGENSKRVITENNGNVLRPEPKEGNRMARNGTETPPPEPSSSGRECVDRMENQLSQTEGACMLTAEVHEQSNGEQTEHKDTSPQRKQSSSNPKAKPSPLTITRNPQSDKSYPCDTLPTQNANKIAVSPKSATFPGPGKNSQTSLNSEQSSTLVTRRQNSAAKPHAQRHSDHRPQSDNAQPSTTRTQSADNIVDMAPHSLERGNSRDCEEAAPVGPSACDTGDDNNSHA